MGLALGATAVNMEWFYGAPLCKDAINDDRLWPYPTPSGLIAHGVLVDAFGHRFVDESIGPEYVADAIAKCRTPGDCWVIVDELTWETVGREGGAPINPTLQEAGGTVLSADNVADLAKATRLPEAALRETVDAFSFRSTTLFALPVIAGITFAMGGLLVDETARVLHRDGHPIAGLYAAGGAMGGLQGGPLSKGYTGGWSEASTFGLLAAEHAVENGDGP
jgi:fumarate reductase flavoprotein subunit